MIPDFFLNFDSKSLFRRKSVIFLTIKFDINLTKNTKNCI